MSKYTQSARGRECTVRIPGICNHNPETVVFAHLNGAGMGRKFPDVIGAYCCSACHSAVDGRLSASQIPISRNELRIAHYEGMVRTQLIMIDEGILKL